MSDGSRIPDKFVFSVPTSVSEASLSTNARIIRVQKVALDNMTNQRNALRKQIMALRTTLRANEGNLEGKIKTAVAAEASKMVVGHQESVQEFNLLEKKYKELEENVEKCNEKS